MTHLIDLHKKKLAIEYYPLQWKEIVGPKAQIFSYHIGQLKQQMHQKIVKGKTFEMILYEIAPKIAESVAVRAVYASLNPKFYSNVTE